MIKQYFLLLLAMVFFQLAYAQPGAIDPSYANGDQLRTLNFLAGQERISYSITDSQNRTWIAGQTSVNGDWRMILSRLDANGNYDASFGGTGYAMINLGNNDVERVEGLALQNDDLLIAGTMINNGKTTPFVLSYTSEGILNTNFGTLGAFVPNNVEMLVTNIKVDPSGAIFLSGFIQDNVVVTKVLADGSGFDQSFGFFGAAVVDFPSTDRSVALDLDNDGNIYVFGYGELNGITRGHVTSFTSEGELNTSFTANSRKSITWPDGKQFLVSDGLIHSASQKIYLSGRTRNPNTGELNTAAVAIDLNGEQDMNFAQNGWMETDLGIGGDDISNSMEEGQEGLYLTVSIQEAPVGMNSGVLHIDERGERISSFGNFGVAKLNVSDEQDDHALSISFQSDNKIILVGIGTSDELGIFGYATRMFTDIASSTRDDIYWEEMSVYPNPARDVLHLSIGSEVQDDLIYSIFNSQGVAIRQRNLSSEKREINITELPTGPYILQIQGYQPQYWIKIE